MPTHRPLLLTSVLSVAFLAATTAPPLAIRHDLEDARYKELGAQFPAVVPISGLASGVLIAEDWVLTVAHAPEMLARMQKGKPLQVTIEGKDHEVARVVYHDKRGAERDRHDIALLQLKTPAPDTVAPLPLWTKTVEPGAQFTLVGWGILSAGDAGIEVSPKAMMAPTRARRAGHNTVERRDDDKGQLFADFDAPTSADAPSDALPMEAGPCIGDSGGPVLIRVAGEDDAADTFHVAGVIALIDDTDEDRIVGEYGEEFGVTAVQPYREWIAATIGR